MVLTSQEHTTLDFHMKRVTPLLEVINLTEVDNLQGWYPLKDEWMVGYSLETRLEDQVVTQQQKWIWSKDSMNSTINQRLVEQTQEITLSWKVVEVLPWMTP